MCASDFLDWRAQRNASSFALVALFLLTLALANRHGLVTGATGSAGSSSGAQLADGLRRRFGVPVHLEPSRSDYVRLLAEGEASVMPTVVDMTGQMFPERMRGSRGR